MSQILAIAPIGIHDVWDIEVEDDHSYIAHGFVNHNSSSSPNLQNVPSNADRRKCFSAGEGKVLCLYDYSGQEANLWAYFSGDDKIAEIINSGKKLYIEMARESFHEEITKEHPRYKKIKSAILGMFYGLTPYGYSKNENVTLEEAQEIFEAIYKAFPKTKAYIDKMQSRNPGTVRSVLGRKMHVHPYDRNWKNDVLNFPMQSSGSDMVKLAMKKLRNSEFYKKYHPLGKLDIILQVHDEIVTEVDMDIAEEWSHIMKTTMIEVAEAMHPGIKGNVSGGLIHDWSQKD